MSLKWSPPLLEHQNGLIAGYIVTWRRLFQDHGSLPFKDTLLGTKNVSETIITIVGLNMSTSYEVNVAAFTAVGIGPFASIIARTTDSKLEQIF